MCSVREFPMAMVTVRRTEKWHQVCVCPHNKNFMGVGWWSSDAKEMVNVLLQPVLKENSVGDLELPMSLFLMR